MKQTFVAPDSKEKWMGHMGNTTCAAASVKLHISVEEFYELYENAKAID